MKYIGNVQSQANAEVFAVASGALPDGKPVIVNSNGTVSVVAQTSGTEAIGTPVVFQSAAVDYTASAYDSNSNRTVVAYRTSGAQYAAVGTVTASNNSISWGTPVSPGSGSSTFNAATFDSSNNKIVLANTAKVRVATVDPSDNSISFGTGVNMPFTAQHVAATFDSNSNRVVIACRKDGSPTDGHAIVGSVSGTDITLGTAVQFESGTTSNISATFDSSNNRVVIAFRDEGNSNHGKAIVGTVDPSDNSITFGTAVTFNAANTGRTACVFDSSSNKVLICYPDANNNNSGTAIVATVDASDNSITYGSETVFDASGGNEVSATYDVAAGKVVIAIADDGDSNKGKVISGTISGTSISFDTSVEYDAGPVKTNAAVYDSTSERVVISYEDDGNSDYGTSAVFSTGYTATNLTSENYIGMSGGAVSYTGDVVPQVIGSSVVYEQAYSSDNRAVFDSNSNRIVVAYTDQGNSSYGTAVVGTVSGTSISFGTPVVFESASSGSFGPAFDSSNNKVVIAYKDDGNSGKGTAIVGTVNPSDNSISFGTAALFESSGTVTFVRAVFDSNANKIVVTYRDHSNNFYGTAAVGTVSGTNISFGTPVVFEAAQTDSGFPVFDSNSNKVVIAYKDSGNSGNGTSIVGTVSGTTISFGSAVVFASASTDQISATFDSNLNKVVIAYRDDGNSNKGTAIVGTVSGTSISFGSEIVFSESTIDELGTSATFDSNINKVVIAYSDGSNSRYGTFRSGTVSGTSISFDATAVFDADRSDNPSATFDSSNNKVVIAYRSANPYYGTAVVSQIGVDTRVTNRGQVADGATALIDTKGAINDNQNALTAGQSYFVQTDGTIGTTAGDPSVFAGTAVSATKLIVKG